MGFSYTGLSADILSSPELIIRRTATTMSGIHTCPTP